MGDMTYNIKNALNGKGTTPLRMNSMHAEQTLQSVLYTCTKQPNTTPLLKIMQKAGYRSLKLNRIRQTASVLLGGLIVIPIVLLIAGKPNTDMVNASSSFGSASYRQGSSPYIRKYYVENNTLTIVLEPGDDGISYNQIYMTSEDGTTYYPKVFEQEAHKVYFTAVTGDITIHLEDYHGNEIEEQISLN